MFKNLSEILEQLKLVREVIATKDANKIGDLIEAFSKIIGYGDFGVSVDDIIDAVVVQDWAKAMFSLGTLLQLISTKLKTKEPLNFGFQGILTGMSPTMSLDNAISACESLERQTTAADAPPTDLPISVWILIAQAGFEVFKMIREYRKNKNA